MKAIAGIILALSLVGCAVGPTHQEKMCNTFSAGVELGQWSLNEQIPPVMFASRAAEMVYSGEFDAEEQTYLAYGLVRGFKGLYRADVDIMALKAYDDCMADPQGVKK